jgi:hypothetical protein
MIKKVVFFILVGFLSLHLLTCKENDDDNNPPEIIAWTKPCKFRNEVSFPQSLTKTPDNGFLVSGFIAYDTSNIHHGFVIRFNSSGDTLWCKKIDFEGYYYCNVFHTVQNSQSEILVAGICFGLENKGERFIAWLDTEGNLTKHIFLPKLTDMDIWETKVFVLSNGDICHASELSPIEGATKGNASIHVEIINEQDQIIRTTDYQNVSTTLDKMYLLDNDQVMLTGYTYPGINLIDNVEMLFLLIDESGNEVYRKQFGSDSWDVGYSACTDHADGYLVSGTLTYSYSPAIFPISHSGQVGQSIIVADTILAQRTFLEKATDGNYAMFILTSKRLYLLKLGSDFQTKWLSWNDTFYSGVYTSLIFYDIVRMDDGSFAFLYIDESGDVLMKTKPI